MLGSAGLHVYVVHRDVQTGPLSLFLAWLFAHTLVMASCSRLSSAPH